jgi:hypothetical protein
LINCQAGAAPDGLLAGGGKPRHVLHRADDIFVFEVRVAHTDDWFGVSREKAIAQLSRRVAAVLPVFFALMQRVSRVISAQDAQITLGSQIPRRRGHEGGKGGTISRVELPGGRIASRRPRAVFDHQPGSKNASEFDDAKDQQKQNRQGQSKFHQALTGRFSWTNSRLDWILHFDLPCQGNLATLARVHSYV